ncbi:hypothetical protein, partial [Vibrio parahaemolyticus]|uniref:hypothetical protein n=1 Tax=Vibrio parahaemolyticus TaxID=670 RepID=UPI002B1FA46D
EGQSTRGDFGSNLGICVFGAKLKFEGSALLPLNAALVCKRKNEAIPQDLAVKVQRQSCGFGYQVQR